LFIGNNDIAPGNAGMDEFVIGDWIEAGNVSLVTDFDTSDDVIIVALADDNADAEVTIDSDGDDRLISIDGVLVARIQGTFDPDDRLDADVFTTTYTPA
jgi:hypothetical protein